MDRDIRQSPEARAVWDFYTALLGPGSGRPFSGADIAPVPGADRVAFTGTAFDGALEDGPVTAVHVAGLGGEVRRVGPPGSRLGRPSPDGASLAYVAPDAGGGERLVLAEPDGSRATPVEGPPGIIEQARWSPDGRAILLVVAGLGADLAGYQGGYATTAGRDDGPAWLPEVSTGEEANLWRRLWLHDLATGATRAVSAEGVNVWEASWCGPERIAIVCTRHHGEGSWYRATLEMIEAADGAQNLLYAPADQIGVPAGAHDGRRLAFVEAYCSDRGIVCGTLRLLDLATGAVSAVDTLGAEVTSLAWGDDGRLTYGAVRGPQTVIGDVAIDGIATEALATEEFVCGEWYPQVQPLPGGGHVFVREAYAMAPELAVLQGGEVRTVHSFASDQARDAMADRGRARSVTWTAPDGLEIQGWLVANDGGGPRPLVLDIHGGPVWASQNRWMGRLRATALLVERDYAVLFPNTRGSGGRGQDFARRVHGDMGGADTGDHLSAIDSLVAAGLADPTRVACTGTSYGGFMSSWLITQDQRFAAAAPISPVSNWYSQHRTSQIPYFDELLLQASAYESGGRFFDRSPAMFANRVKTPVLVLAGALDKNTPPGQALEFHQSVREHGGDSALVVYPQDGHSLRGYPAFLDSAARILIWFGKWIG